MGQIFRYIIQGCGSGLIQYRSGYGSGSRNLAQSGYGSGSTMSLNPDPDTDPDPQQDFKRQIYSKIKKPTKKSKISAVCTILIPFRYKN
jgi:hypothetical protein